MDERDHLEPSAEQLPRCNLATVGRAALEQGIFALRVCCFPTRPTSNRRDRAEKQFLFTYVACFGIVPRSGFSRVGGFDEQFKGWGCEDVELVSRLLATVPLVNLFNRYVVFHLDHVVSPYKNVERVRSQKMLWRILKARNQMFDAYRFASVVTKGKNIPVTYWPFPGQAGS